MNKWNPAASLWGKPQHSTSDQGRPSVLSESMNTSKWQRGEYDQREENHL